MDFMRTIKRIGIDPGVNTGLSITISGAIQDIYSTDVLTAMSFIEKEIMQATPEAPLHIYFEDANLCKFKPTFSRDANKEKRLQGAGAIKGMCKVWILFFNKFSHISKVCVNIFFINPLNNTLRKIDSIKFKRLTGWTKKTNGHGRDAHGLIYGLK